jgi:hypothetical protein
LNQNIATPAAGRPKHLWIVGIVSLLWNAMGAFDYLMTQTRNEAYMANFTEAQLEYFYGFPAWVEATWALAVWGALVGSVFLLLGKRLAVWLFLLSLVSMALTTVHNYFISNGLEVVGDPMSIVFSVIIAVVSILLYVYSRNMAAKGVLN